MEDAEQLTWRRSTRSGGGNNDNCVEVATYCGRVLVRDSKDPHGAVLEVRPAQWQGFLAEFARHS
jgi:hypothetical protein